jgi:tetratricopeptide (TPR) repeat protein
VANYFLENKLSAEEAAKYADRSIAIEDRFENEMTRARALDALGRKDEALATQNKALAMGSERQVYEFARGLQRLAQQDQALEIFRHNVKKHPDTWLAHVQTARLAAAQGDYNPAVKEMTLAISLAPERSKAGLTDLLRQLEQRVDINK